MLYHRPQQTSKEAFHFDSSSYVIGSETYQILWHCKQKFSLVVVVAVAITNFTGMYFEKMNIA